MDPTIPALAPAPTMLPLSDPALPPGQLLLTVPQVARLLAMTPKAIYHRAERGQLPGVVRVGRSLRFRRADLLRSVLEGRGLSPR